MSNPFKILIVIAVVLAVGLAAGLTYVVFLKDPGHVSRSLSAQSLVEIL